MRAVKAKQLRNTVALAMYGEHATDGKFSNEDMRDIRNDAQFKKIYRRRKKNEITTTAQVNAPEPRRKVNNRPFPIFGLKPKTDSKNFMGNGKGNPINVHGTIKYRRYQQFARGKDGTMHIINHYIKC
jgi:hypothetical protein